MDTDLALLLDRWRDGSLSMDERAALARRLRDDPALCARVGAELRFQGQLTGSLRQDDERLWARVNAVLELGTDGRVAEGVMRRLGTSSAVRQRWAWRWWPAAVAALLVLGLGLLVLVDSARPSTGVTVALSDDGVDSAPHARMALTSPLSCSDDQHANIAFADGSLVDVSANSAVRLAAMDRSGAQLELTRGSLQAVIAKQPSGSHFVIHTREATLTVLGTRFSATRFPWGTRVEVVEGRVLTRQLINGAEVEVPAGMRVDVGMGMDALRILTPMPLLHSVPVGALVREPVADAICIAGRSAHENRGKLPSHLLTSLEAPIDERREFYLRFDLSGIRRPVANASLYLHINHISHLGVRMEVAQVADVTWSETAITWDTRPKAGLQVAEWLPGQDEVPIDLTAAINAISANENLLSLRIRAAPGMPPHATVGVNTREAIDHKRPRLVLIPTTP